MGENFQQHCCKIRARSIATWHVYKNSSYIVF
jgi:hypothetical protein